MIGQMPAKRGPCKWPTLAAASGLGEERCDLKELTRGLCRGHYDQARRLKLLEMEGTGPKGGRPTGPKLATPLRQDWMDGPARTVSENREVGLKLIYHLMTDPGSAQQERNLAMKLAVTMEDQEGDEATKERFQELLSRARPLKAVSDD